VKEVLHVGSVVGVGDVVVGFEVVCWLAVMVVMVVLLQDYAVL
jgi:hypothetical protein